MNERLRRETTIATRSQSTPADWETVCSVIKFPEDLEGKIILDICSGASNVVAILNHRGVKACGIDFKYDDMKSLRRRINRDLTDFNGFKAIFLDKDLRHLALLYILLCGEHPATMETFKEFSRKGRKTKECFFNDVSRNGSYIAATAGDLPFQDNSIDFCFSVSGITSFLIKDEEIFINAVDEAIRVLKPGCQLQLYAWGETPHSSKRSLEKIETSQMLLDYLSDNNVPFAIEESSLGPRLSITKPLA